MKTWRRLPPNKRMRGSGNMPSFITKTKLERQLDEAEDLIQTETSRLNTFNAKYNTDEFQNLVNSNITDPSTLTQQQKTHITQYENMKKVLDDRMNRATSSRDQIQIRVNEERAKAAAEGLKNQNARQAAQAQAKAAEAGKLYDDIPLVSIFGEHPKENIEDIYGMRPKQPVQPVPSSGPIVQPVPSSASSASSSGPIVQPVQPVPSSASSSGPIVQPVQPVQPAASSASSSGPIVQPVEDHSNLTNPGSNDLLSQVATHLAEPIVGENPEEQLLEAQREAERIQREEEQAAETETARQHAEALRQHADAIAAEREALRKQRKERGRARLLQMEAEEAERTRIRNEEVAARRAAERQAQQEAAAAAAARAEEERQAQEEAAAAAAARQAAERQAQEEADRAAAARAEEERVAREEADRAAAEAAAAETRKNNAKRIAQVAAVAAQHTNLRKGSKAMTQRLAAQRAAAELAAQEEAARTAAARAEEERAEQERARVAREEAERVAADRAAAALRRNQQLDLEVRRRAEAAEAAQQAAAVEAERRRVEAEAAEAERRRVAEVQAATERRRLEELQARKTEIFGRIRNTVQANTIISAEFKDKLLEKLSTRGGTLENTLNAIRAIQNNNSTRRINELVEEAEKLPQDRGEIELLVQYQSQCIEVATLLRTAVNIDETNNLQTLLNNSIQIVEKLTIIREKQQFIAEQNEVLKEYFTNEKAVLNEVFTSNTLEETNPLKITARNAIDAIQIPENTVPRSELDRINSLIEVAAVAVAAIKAASDVKSETQRILRGHLDTAIATAEADVPAASPGEIGELTALRTAIAAARAITGDLTDVIVGQNEDLLTSARNIYDSAKAAAEAERVRLAEEAEAERVRLAAEQTRLRGLLDTAITTAEAGLPAVSPNEIPTLTTLRTAIAAARAITGDLTDEIVTNQTTALTAARTAYDTAGATLNKFMKFNYDFNLEYPMADADQRKFEKLFTSKTNSSTGISAPAAVAAAPAPSPAAAAVAAAAAAVVDKPAQDARYNSLSDGIKSEFQTLYTAYPNPMVAGKPFPTLYAAVTIKTVVDAIEASTGTTDREKAQAGLDALVALAGGPTGFAMLGGKRHFTKRQSNRLISKRFSTQRRY